MGRLSLVKLPKSLQNRTNNNNKKHNAGQPASKNSNHTSFEDNMKKLQRMASKNDNADDDADSEEGTQLLSDLLDGSKKKKRKKSGSSATFKEARDEAEFAVSTAEGPNSLSVEKLLSSLDGSQAALMAKTKKKLKMLTDPNEQTLGVPLERHQIELSERRAITQHNKKELRRWVPAIREMKEQPIVRYPLHEPPSIIASAGVSQLVDDFVPENAMEKKIHAALCAAGVASEPLPEGTNATSSDFLVLSDEVVELMGAEAQNTRRQQLSKLRAVMSYKRAKLARIKKIKSKVYRRISRKNKVKQEEKSLERLEQIDPQAAIRKRREKMEYERALERATLRHKNTSRFARKKKEHAKYNPALRDELLSASRIAQQLTKKFDEPADEFAQRSDSSSSDDEDDLQTDAVTKGEKTKQNTAESIIQSLRSEINAPAPIDRKGISALPFMKRARAREKEELLREVAKLEQDVKLTAAKNASSENSHANITLEDNNDLLDPDADDVDVLKGEEHLTNLDHIPKNLKRQKLEENQILNKNSKKNIPVEVAIKKKVIIDEKTENCIICHQQFPASELPQHRRECEKTKMIKCKSCKLNLAWSDVTKHQALCAKMKVRCPRCHLTMQRSALLLHSKKCSNNATVSATTTTTTAFVSSINTSEPTAKTVESNDLIKSEKRETKETKVVPSSQKKKATKSAKKKKNSKKEKTVKVNSSEIAKEYYSEDDDSEAEAQAMLNSKDYLVSRAFACDNIDEDFMKEKEATIEKDIAPVDANKALPGWGEWGGSDPALNLRQKRKWQELVDSRKEEVAVLRSQRKDAGLDNVIINEDLDAVPRKFRTKRVPRQYATVEDFANAVRHPLAPELNAELVNVKQLTAKIKIKQGTIIHPITPYDMPPKPPQKTTRRKTEPKKKNK